MNQDEFRKLLETPRAGGSSSGTQRPRFGQLLKRGAPLPKEEYKRQKPDLKPRNQKASEWKAKKKVQDESAYRDRAAERRQGKDGDFSAAEKLLEDFNARAEGADIDQATLDEQRKYLGGDAEHSVLVKGLDFALLDRQKFEQARLTDDKLADVEDELDAALSAKPKPAPGADGQPRKRTRDEMLAELKAGRASATQPPPSEAPALGKGFKPIGFKPFGKSADEGKKKKKKKVVEEVKMEVPETQAKKEEAPPPPEEDDVDADADIFGDVGEWRPESDSDSDAGEAEKKLSAAAVDAVTISKPAKYFDDDEDDLFARSTVPTAVANLGKGPADGPSSRPLGDDTPEEEGEAPPMRLQGLSSSNLPSARELLEMDKAAEREEKRREKKAKWKATAAEKREEKERNMTEEDKANRDFQLMQNHLAKQKEKKTGQEPTWDIPGM